MTIKESAKYNEANKFVIFYIAFFEKRFYYCRFVIDFELLHNNTRIDRRKPNNFEFNHQLCLRKFLRRWTHSLFTYKVVPQTDNVDRYW